MEKEKLTVEAIEHISIRELAFKIKAVDYDIKNPKDEEARANRRPNLAFFLGAGASKDSGVILAGEMMKIFKNEIFEINCPELETDDEKRDWLKKQTSWYKDGKDEYGCLFEKFRDTRSARQRFIESICRTNPLTGKAIEPSFGYLILADLLLRNYINTVVTTNFDDLVYISATTFTGNRPIIYAYGVLASEMKISATHSRVLKLHGDYLYSNIVNTDDEMNAQSDAVKNPGRDMRATISDLNMERQVRTVLDNYGLIVVGYAGGDKTIMKLLEGISEHNGFYWCYIKDYPPDEDVLKLVESKNGKLVEITGFDDMMKDIADVTNFSIDDLLASFERRKENLVQRITEFNERYTKKSLGKYANNLTEKQKDKPSESLSAADYFVLGDKSRKEGNSTLAAENYRKAIELNPKYVEAYNNLALILDEDLNKSQEAEENYNKALELNPKPAIYFNLGNLLDKNKTRWAEAEKNYRNAIELNPDYVEAYHNLGNLLYKQKKFADAIELFQTAIKLNSELIEPRISLAGVYKKLDKENESKKYIDEVLALIKEHDYYNLASLNLILGNKDEALKFLKSAVEIDSFYKIAAKTDSDFQSIHDDERFWEIVGKDNK